MLFIINPISGKGKKKKITQMLLDRGHKVACTEYAGHGEILAREASEKTIVAVGGDGTVNEVARGLIGSDKTLGIIPCGSGDGLARHLGLSHNIEKAIKTIEQGKAMDMDAALVNDRVFISVCGVGFDAVVSERFALCGKRGLWNYIKQGLKTWRTYEPESYTVTIDGEAIETKALFITIGNSDQWGNNARITPLADCSDGLLEVTIVNKFSSIELPWLGLKLMTGRIHKSRHVTYLHGKEITIVRNSAGPAHADGDWFTTGNSLVVKIIPKALKIIIP